MKHILHHNVKNPTKQRQQRQPCFTVFTVRPITANSRTSIFNQKMLISKHKTCSQTPLRHPKDTTFFLAEGPVGKNQG